MILGKADRKITVIDRGDSVVIVDARSGTQHIHRMPKRQAKRLLALTKTDTIVVDAATLAVTIEPRAIAATEPPVPKRPAARPAAAEKPPREAKPKTRRVCKHLGELLPNENFPPSEGLGDLIADGLKMIGITKERWAALVSQGKLDGVCSGCDGRQRFANWLGSKLRLPAGQGPLLQKMLADYDLTPQAVNACAVHGKCLSRLRGSDELRAACESAGFHWCNGCSERELVVIEVP